MPTPRKGEKRKDWLKRCMADGEQRKTNPDQDQRYAVCVSKWNRRNKAEMAMATMAESNKLISSKGELLLYGTVGAGLFDDGNSFTAKEVALALASISRSQALTIRLNSGGGIATEGAAIHAILSEHRGKKTLIIEGIAASAASLIAMAGDETIMQLGATMMIHDPSAITVGNSAAHGKSIEALEVMASNYADIYAERTGDTPAKMREVMKAETWFTAQDAIDANLADRIDRGRRQEPTAFDYRLYQHAPNELVALATDRNWQLRSDFDDGDGQAANDGDDDMAQLTPEEKKAAAAKRVTAITNICALANKPAKAEAFIKDETKTPDDVMAALKAEADQEAADKAKQDNGGKETPDQITARVRKEEQKRCADISAACQMAGKPSKAAAFIADSKSVSEVLAALQADKSAPEKVISARTGTQEGGGESKDFHVGWDKQAKRINARFGG